MLALASACSAYQAAAPTRIAESRVSAVTMDNSWRRSYDGKAGAGGAATAPASSAKLQDFLEADPSYEVARSPS